MASFCAILHYLLYGMIDAFISFVIISEEARFAEKKIYVKMYFDSLRKLYTTILSFQEEFSEILP